MGWFAIAAVSGFLAFHAWRVIPPRPLWRVFAWLLTLILVGAALAGWFYVLMLRYRGVMSFYPDVRAHTDPQAALLAKIDWILDALSGGEVARALLGLALGFGTGYALAQPADAASQWPLRQASQTRVPLLQGPGKHIVLLLGAGTLALAIVAPYVDYWMRAATQVKSPWFELELKSARSHRVAVAQGKESLFDADALGDLSSYDEKLQDDIKYLTFIEIPQLTGGERDKKQRILTALTELQSPFQDLISQVARCADTAMKEGLSIGSLREELKPAADLMERIVLHRDDPDGAATEERAWEAQADWNDHDAFWRDIEDVPLDVNVMRVDKRQNCPPISFTGSLPRIRAYRNVPYLYTAAAYFLSFLKDDDLALKVLKDGADHAEPDYGMLYLTARLAYYAGDVTTSLKAADTAIARTQRHLERLEAYHRHDQCQGQNTLSGLKKVVCALIDRERKAELLFINLRAYYTAEDSARRGDTGGTQIAVAEELAATLDDAVKNGEADGPDLDKYAYRDTIAYVQLVAEAQKSHPDRNVFQKSARTFKLVLGEFEAKKKNQGPEPLQEWDINIARTHYDSARELAGE